MNEKNELHNRSMHISRTFREKQDIGTVLSPHQQKQFEKIAAEFGGETVFGRGDVAELLGITASPASALIKKLADAGKIEPVAGHGKGKYTVKRK